MLRVLDAVLGAVLNVMTVLTPWMVGVTTLDTILVPGGLVLMLAKLDAGTSQAVHLVSP